MKVHIMKSDDSFRQLRENGAYYVDKTDLIVEYLDKWFEKAVLFTRPRRFGKTMTMTMFRDFLDILQDSKDIFEGLKIMDYPDVVSKYMNQYPVMFISMKAVTGDDFDKVLQNFAGTISKLCEDNSFLMSSTKVSDVSKALFETLWKQEGNQATMERALEIIGDMLKKHFGKPVFVIIDEYDVPMAKALDTSHYEQVRDMVERMLSHVCKTNSNIQGVILSGCLYTVKNSTYTGVNNIISYSVFSPLYASYIGFTDEDVRKLLKDADLSDLYDTVKEWYDGYIFGRQRMYCPWDVLSFVQAKLSGSYDEYRGPESYWVGTSESAQDLIHGFLGKTTDVNERFEQLLAGGTIECVVDECVPYHRIHDRGENLWSALVETGYLTRAVEGRPLRMPLRIPNRSIQKAFQMEVWSYFKDKVDNVFVGDLVNALWAGQTEMAQKAMNQILEATLSFYHEYHEYSYHLILDGFFTGMGYRVQSERETGYGRSDLIILDMARNRSLILELKHLKKEGAKVKDMAYEKTIEEKMEAALQEGVSQAIRMKYESQLIYEGYTMRLQYAMAFCEKRARIARIS
ncbi:MAG: AAA family ATPase [Clostridia bacterium]|nr:AAA family ATPase [Clostridia bacterium]